MSKTKQKGKEDRVTMSSILSALNTIIGVIVVVYIGHKWSNYLQLLHENQMFFSNIKEVEREISFRTESGLYYSYFKHLVNAESILAGKHELTRDNLTEHLNSINIFSRFNIHQELFLATVYSIYDFGMEPILFYVEFVFSLQGFYMGVLLCLCWYLSGSWFPGVLTAAFITCHRYLVTRVENTIPLREHWSMPFVFTQFFIVGYYLEHYKNRSSYFGEKLCLASIFITTFIFTITWQFSPFILLLQATALFYLGTIAILDRNAICKIYLVNLMAVLCVWYCQFYQSFIISSLFVSFVPPAIILLQTQSNFIKKENLGIIRNLLFSFLRLGFVIFSAFLLNMIFKVSINQQADNHILEFVRSKFGTVDKTRFETQLYLCLSAFQPQEWEFYRTLTKNTFLFPIYSYFVIQKTLCIALTAFRKWFLHPKVGEEVKTRSNANKNKKAIDAKENVGGVKSRSGANVNLQSRRNVNTSETKDIKEMNSNEESNNGDEDHQNRLQLFQHWFQSFLDYIESANVFRFVTHMDDRPMLSFHICQSIIFGILAATTRRFQCFWTPYMCIFAACALADNEIWSGLIAKLQNTQNQTISEADSNLQKNASTGTPKNKTEASQKASSGSSVTSILTSFVKHVIVLFVIIALFKSHQEEINKELEDLREFWDPDTVDLMEWINKDVPKDAAFTGSMQLLAGVRLCTWRPITNHPHFEDQDLRDRTRELYKIYGQFSPKEVHTTLNKYNSSYIILEDSICLAPTSMRKTARCTLNEIVDLTYGFIPEDGIREPKNLVKSKYPRFCDEIRHNSPSYTKYFRKVFENRTFRVYKVAPPPPDSPYYSA